ncbi:hypothetical protein [Nocardia puris]|uniref:hypothetical protein n=1 Tax=Nocardia puris TaxID=208602 RepID=UPI0018DD4855|nr:hypothetical protein [Nocardia puris]
MHVAFHAKVVELPRGSTVFVGAGLPALCRYVVLIEDVVTTGGAVRAAARQLRARGATVDTVVCAIDRSPAREHALAAGGVTVRPVLTKDLLDRVTD